jgi:hypothetical protein
MPAKHERRSVGSLGRRIAGSADRRIAGAANPPITRSRGLSLLRFGAPLLCLVCVAAPAHAQFPDARLVPRGVLRIGFEPSWASYGERFDSAGTRQPLGTDFSDGAAGLRLFPTLAEPQSAVASIVGDSTYAMNLGVFRTTLDVDIRRFPLSLQFGLSDRLAFTAAVPIVTTRSHVDFVVDSTETNVGWNQVASQAANGGAGLEIQGLLMQLESAAAAVEAGIAAGDYGCPVSATCDEARAAVADARQLKLDLAVLSGVSETGVIAPVISPFAPLAGSTAGAAIETAVQSIASRFAALGAPAVTGTFPLPTNPVGAGGVNAMLPDTALGYGALPLGFTKYKQKLGDVELGLRFGVVQSTAVRAVLATTVRLPTGSIDAPDNYLDVGTGDHQVDVEFAFEGAWEPGSFLGLAASASYNLQLGGELERRVTSHVRPIGPLATQALVSRNLGDELRAAAFPSIRLSRTLTVYGSASYYRRATDRFALAGSDGSAALDPAELEFETAMSTWSFGGGLHYYAAESRTGRNLPLEAGLDYRTAFQGNGGQAPKTTSVMFYLRIPVRIFGGTPAPPPAEAAPEPPPAPPGY